MMKLTLAWLKEHLDTEAPLAAIVDRLTMIGLEVESVADRGKMLAPFTIARVISAEQHPNADRLRVCMVDTGAGDRVQVVCGAPNARAGMKGVFVPPGAFIPGKNMTLGIGKIRGVESRGMLVSEFELQISDDHEGIIDLPQDAPVGANYATWAGLDDPVIEINLTPNRADCAGVSGIARDLAAAEIGKLRDQGVQPVKGEFPSPVKVTLDFGVMPSLCPAFALRLVRGVRNGPSPAWLQQRLSAIGLRPINALVDITNFITYDRGRPLHVFDAAKVHGNLTVRRARDGESLVALDGKRYPLDPSMCVIADESGVESLAGIMGGESTGCSETTTDVLIESALWDAVNIAQTGRKLGVQSDARYRFERGVDPAFMLPGLELATAMVLELCGGTPSDTTVAGTPEVAARIIDFPLDELPRLTGLRVDRREIERVLGHLGFAISDAGKHLNVTVPSWRADVEGKADVVEEIVRILGVDRIPATPFDRGEAPRKPVLKPIQLRTRKAKRALAARGMLEAVISLKAAGRVVWRRRTRTRARQSHCLGSVGHATESHSRAHCRRAEQCRPRLYQRGTVRNRTGVSRGSPAGATHGGERRAPRTCQSNRHRPPLVDVCERGERVRRQSRRDRRASGCRRAGGGAANRAGRAIVVPSGALWHDPNGPADGPRAFWRVASARARGA
jgi:phenylalanyl-tRNA synthetase beta chain